MWWFILLIIAGFVLFGGRSKRDRLEADLWDPDPTIAEQKYREATRLWR
jgi:hypothetical protein